MDTSPPNEPNVASPLMDQPPPYSAVAPPTSHEAKPYQPTTTTAIQPTPVLVQHSAIVVQPAPVSRNVVVVAATTCPACQAGILQSDFTLCGICLAIWFFPWGLICCFLMKESRCTNCRAVYS